MRRYSMLVAVSVLFSAGAHADQRQIEAQVALNHFKQLSARPVADPKLEAKKLDGLRKLGFAAKEEVSSAVLANAVQVYMVQLDNLRSYRAGTDDPAELLTVVDSQIYPIRVKGVAKASVFIDRGTLSGYGSPQLTRKLELTRAQLVEQTKLPEDAFFLVNVRALNARFVGHYEQSKPLTVRRHPVRAFSPAVRSVAGPIAEQKISTRTSLIVQPRPLKRLMLTALHEVKLPLSDRDDRYITLPAGKTLDADKVFRTLLPSAKNLDVTVPR